MELSPISPDELFIGVTHACDRRTGRTDIIIAANAMLNYVAWPTNANKTKELFRKQTSSIKINYRPT